MEHPLFTQLKFTRSEFMRCIAGVSDAEALVRHGQMNCISWIIGHMANQEQTYWLLLGQDKLLHPNLNSLVGTGKPASTPPLAEMLDVWYSITNEADDYLQTVTPELLQTHFVYKGQSRPESIGTMLYRNIYHYWFHLGENMAARKLMGHEGLGQFVGNIDAEAPYTPETGG